LLVSSLEGIRCEYSPLKTVFDFEYRTEKLKTRERDPQISSEREWSELMTSVEFCLRVLKEPADLHKTVARTPASTVAQHSAETHNATDTRLLKSMRVLHVAKNWLSFLKGQPLH